MKAWQKLTDGIIIVLKKCFRMSNCAFLVRSCTPSSTLCLVASQGSNRGLASSASNHSFLVKRLSSSFGMMKERCCGKMASHCVVECCKYDNYATTELIDAAKLLIEDENENPFALEVQKAINQRIINAFAGIKLFLGKFRSS